MENPLPEDALPDNEEIIEDEPEQVREKPEFSVSNSVQTVISIGLVMATLLTLWNPRKVFKTTSLTALLEAEAAQKAEEAEASQDGNNHIGILAGYWEDSNPGEVCADGLTEADVNYDIASRVKLKLESEGYQVDLFPEYDLKFLNYEGVVFVALYSGSCAEDPQPASGFSIGGSVLAQNPDEIDRLATCISKKYQNATILPFTYEVIDTDHASHHIFRDIGPTTPAIRLEMGSLKTDRLALTTLADSAAQGISSGIICFINNELDD